MLFWPNAVPVAVDDVTHQKPFEIISVNVVATRTHKIPMEPIFKWLWRKTKIFNLQMNGEYLSDFPKRKRRIYFNTFISVCSIVSHLIVSRLSWASTTVNYLYSSYRHYVWLACVFALAPHWIGFSSQIDTKLFFAFAAKRFANERTQRACVAFEIFRRQSTLSALCHIH